MKHVAMMVAGVLAVVGASAIAEERESAACARSLAACPVHGCADPGTPHALTNEIKRTQPSKNAKWSWLTFEDFGDLQEQASERVGEGKHLDAVARTKLRDLTISGNRKVSEGSVVQITGHVIGLPNRPKPSGKESVNCRLTGVKNNDYHIPMAEDASDTEFNGIVVEMIPQNRPASWTTRKLRTIAKEDRPVAVRGQLFYDSPHKVNDDPDDELRSEPKRFSLWEIHPVTHFWVCANDNKKCNRQQINEGAGWIPLADWEPGD